MDHSLRPCASRQAAGCCRAGLLRRGQSLCHYPASGSRSRRRGIGIRLFRVLRLAIFESRRRANSEPASSQLSKYVGWEALLALAVFACTTVLSEATPARHTAFERKPTSHVTPVEPRSGGSASSTGTVTPPPGDPARGRALFVKLRCVACHTVGTERVPAPSQPGPIWLALAAATPVTSWSQS